MLSSIVASSTGTGCVLGFSVTHSTSTRRPHLNSFHSAGSTRLSGAGDFVSGSCASSLWVACASVCVANCLMQKFPQAVVRMMISDTIGACLCQVANAHTQSQQVVVVVVWSGCGDVWVCVCVGAGGRGGRREGEGRGGCGGF